MSRFVWSLTLFALTFLSAAALADGFMVIDPPRDRRVPVTGFLRIGYHHVRAEIEGTVAQVRIKQSFINEADYAVEGTYVFPIPEEAVITNFTLIADGKELKGEILPKEEAQRYYEEIVRKRRDPALLEYVGRGLYRARIFPIEAKAKVEVEIKYAQTLKPVGNFIEWLYPLSAEKHSSANLEEVKLTGRIKQEGIHSAYSPSHAILVTHAGTALEFAYEEKNTRPDRDFLLYYTTSEGLISHTWLTHRRGDQDGFFLMVASPKLDIEEKIVPKDIVFVLDKSGSMSGEKIEQAKEAARFFVNSLRKEDRFNLIWFSDGAEARFKAIQPADAKNKKEAVSSITPINADGGTNIHEALLLALEQLKSDRPSYVVFLTDGQATVGITETTKILEDIKRSNKRKARLFVFGVGYDVNTLLLDRLSIENYGEREYVKPEENIELKTSSLLSKIQSPVLTEVALSFPDRLGVYDVLPKQFPDLFKGSQLVVTGRYRNSGREKVTLSGREEDKKKTFDFPVDFDERAYGRLFVAQFWAQRKIGFLLDQLRLHGEQKELVDEVVRLSRTYGIMTPYTSFLADEERFAYSKEEAAERFRDIVAAEPPTGAAAVAGSQSANLAQKSAQVNAKGYEISADVAARLQQVQGRAFFLKKGIWVESTYQKEETRKITFGSEAYFELARDPQVAPVLSLGTRVIFRHNGQWLEIEDETS